MFDTISNFLPTEFNSEAVTDDDVVSVLRSLRRLQIIYEFEVNEMTNGEVGGYTFENFTGNIKKTLYDGTKIQSWRVNKKNKF